MNTVYKTILRCLRCGYEWSPRGDVEPSAIKACPGCKHYKWRFPKADDPYRPIKKPTEIPEPISTGMMDALEPCPDCGSTHHKSCELGGSREYDQYRKAHRNQTMKPEKTMPTEKPLPDELCECCGKSLAECGAEKAAIWDQNHMYDEKPTEKPEPCHDCGEDGEFWIEATDLNFTDQGTEYITYKEWFCAECYQRRTANE